ncbi:MAG: hypothetical protein WDW38_009412 [Sanguina aurantia]
MTLPRNDSTWQNRAVDQDLDWEPTITRKGPLMAPGRGSYTPPPPPPIPPGQRPNMTPGGGPFQSRRAIALTIAISTAALYGFNHTIGTPIDAFGDKPDIPFDLVGYSDLAADKFVYFKTPAGSWVAAAEDKQGRFFMIDQAGDLYFDTGDPQVGMYAMDTQGNLFNFYVDTDGQQKITPVGSVNDLQKFKISEIAGMKLDRDVNVVAFQDNRPSLLPPGSTYIDAETGQEMGPDTLVEGINTKPRRRRGDRTRGSGGLLEMFKSRSSDNTPIDRMELDNQDSTSFARQMFDQTLLDDSDIPGFQPDFPEDFDLNGLVEQVKAEAKTAGRR